MNEIRYKIELLNLYPRHFWDLRERHFRTKTLELVFFRWRHTWPRIFRFILILNHVYGYRKTFHFERNYCIQEHSWAFRPILFLSTKKNPSMKKIEELILLKFSAVELKKKKNPHEVRTRKSTIENRHSNPPPLSHCRLRVNYNFGLHTHKDI